MVDCRFKRNKKKCKIIKKKVKKVKKIKKKVKKKYGQRQKQSQTINIFLHKKTGKKKQKRNVKKQYPRLPKVNAAAASVPLIINNYPEKTQDSYIAARHLEEINKQRNINIETMEMNKILYGKNIANTKNMELIQETITKLPELIKEKEKRAKEAGIQAGKQAGIAQEKASATERRSVAAKKGQQTKIKNLLKKEVFLSWRNYSQAKNQ